MTDHAKHELVGAGVPSGHPEAVPKPVLHRAIAASALGNATEWFDYGIYAYGSNNPTGSVTIRNNIIRNSYLDGFEISSYSDINFNNNKAYNIARHGLNSYPNNRSGDGFAWGNNFKIINNTIDKANWGFRISFDPYSDGTVYKPKGVVIDGNTLSNIRQTGIAAINVGNGPTEGMQIIRNKLNNISSGQYFNIHNASTAVQTATGDLDIEGTGRAGATHHWPAGRPVHS